MTHTANTGSAKSIPVGIGFGLLSNVIVSVLGLCVVAGLLNKETVPETAMELGVMAVQLSASLAGAAVAVLMIKKNRLIASLISGGCYFLLLLAGTALFFGGQYHGVISSLLAILVGCICIGLLGLKGKKSNASSKYKIRNR